MSSAAGPPAAPNDVLVRRENGVLVVTINRPQQRNAVNGAVPAGIARALDLLDSSSDLRVGVLHGAGFAFCAIESADWPLAEGFQRQRAYLDPVFASQDAAEGVAAFRERRDRVWQDR